MSLQRASPRSSAGSELVSDGAQEPMRSAMSSSSSVPFGDDPSMTPRTPRPSSVWARTTWSGFAVAQIDRADLRHGLQLVETFRG